MMFHLISTGLAEAQLVLEPRFVRRLAPGHRIGKPAPLFVKIEQQLVDELKQRFGGSQVPPLASSIWNQLEPEANPPVTGFLILKKKKKETIHSEPVRNWTLIIDIGSSTRSSWRLVYS